MIQIQLLQPLRITKWSIEHGSTFARAVPAAEQDASRRSHLASVSTPQSTSTIIGTFRSGVSSACDQATARRRGWRRYRQRQRSHRRTHPGWSGTRDCGWPGSSLPVTLHIDEASPMNRRKGTVTPSNVSTADAESCVRRARQLLAAADTRLQT